jgi:hypothetical protein
MLLLGGGMEAYPVVFRAGEEGGEAFHRECIGELPCRLGSDLCAPGSFVECHFDLVLGVRIRC